MYAVNASSTTSGRLAPKAWCLDDRTQVQDLKWTLLLDDDVVNTRALSRWLKREFGMDTRSAQTIHQADCWLRSMPTPTAIITDFDLAAGETGAGALQHFRHGGVDVPALVLTGAPTRAQQALDRLGLTGISVLSKGHFHDQLGRWLELQQRSARPVRTGT